MPSIIGWRPRLRTPRNSSIGRSSAPRSELRRRAEKDVARKTATRKLQASRKARGLLEQLVARIGTLYRRRRFGGRLGQAGARPRQPGRAAVARQNPQRRQRHARQARRQSAAERPRSGARLRHRRALQGTRAALRKNHHHDRRRRRRRPYRLAAHHLFLSRRCRNSSRRGIFIWRFRRSTG